MLSGEATAVWGDLRRRDRSRGGRRAALRALVAAAAFIWWVTPVAAQAPPASLIQDEDIEEISELDLEALLAAPTVESASKRRQSLEEAPGAVTVIEGTELAEAGAVTIADALRLVPGLWVFHTNANMFHVGVRGMGGPSTMSMLVLINGRRFHELTWGFAPWGALPLHVGDIDRIEVLRGPGAPLYGADALNGLINIVTKHATQHLGVEGSLSAGASLLPDDPGTQGRSRVSNLGRGYLATGLRSEDGRWAGRGSFGFGVLPEWQESPAAPGTDFYRHGQMGYHAALTLDYSPDRDLQTSLDLRHVLAESPMLYENSPTASISMNEQSAVFTLEKKRLGLENLTLKATLDARRMSQSGRPLTFERINARNRAYHALLQADLSLWDGANILTGGIEGAYRSSGGWWDTETTSRYAAVLMQNETALFDRKLVLSGAARYEGIVSTSNAGLRARYVNFNPRLSVIGRVGRRHTLRTSAATSYRTPTPFQTFVNAVPEYHPPPMPTSYAVVGNPGLRPEQLRSFEVGYRGRAAYWLRLDLTAFVQRATDILDHPFTSVPIQTQNWRNETHFGFDLGTQIRPSDTVSGFLNYGFLHARPDRREDASRFPPHILSAGTVLVLPGSFRLRGDFTYVAPITSTFIFTDYNVVFARDSKRVPEQIMLNLRVGYQVVNRQTEVFLMGTNLLAPLRSHRSLVQYPQPGVSPIGAVFLIGMEMRAR
jgi:iron complex outermembrane receptor protein